MRGFTGFASFRSHLFPLGLGERDPLPPAVLQLRVQQILLLVKHEPQSVQVLEGLVPKDPGVPLLGSRGQASFPPVVRKEGGEAGEVGRDLVLRELLVPYPEGLGVGRYLRRWGCGGSGGEGTGGSTGDGTGGLHLGRADHLGQS